MAKGVWIMKRRAERASSTMEYLMLFGAILAILIAVIYGAFQDPITNYLNTAAGVTETAATEVAERLFP